MNKKGQSALEFIMTYGWALVVLLLVVGSLWFTFGGHKMFVNEKCMMGPGFLCKDFLVDEGSIQLKVLNGQGKNLDSISFTHTDCTVSSDDISLKNGEEKLFTVTGCPFEGLEVFDDRLDFAYKFVDSSIMHSKATSLIALISNGNSQAFGGGGSGNGYGSDGSTLLLYKFDESDGALIRDESSNGNDGTHYGNTELLLHFDGDVNDYSGNGLDGTMVNFGGFDFSNNVLRFHFDEGSGTITKDDSGNGNDGSLGTSVVWKSGSSTNGYDCLVSGFCLEFDSNDYVIVPDSPSLDIQQNAVTIMGWFKPSVDIVGASSNYPLFLMKRPWNIGGYGAHFDKNSGKINFQYCWSGTCKSIISNTAFNADTWYHYAGVLSTNKMELYIDGVLESSDSSVTETMASSANTPLTIGQNFEGIIDEVAVYSKSFTAQEVSDYYDMQRVAFSGFASGVSGQSLEFDGVDDYVDFGNPTELQIIDDQTIIMWLNPAVKGDGRRKNPYNKAYGGEGTITLEPSGSLNYYYGTAGSNAQPYQGIANNNNYNANEWVQLALVRDLKNMKLRWYKNGAEILEDNANYAQAVNSNLNLLIGDGYTSNFYGMIDEVGVYSTAVSDDQIKRMNDAGKVMFGDWADGKYGTALSFDGEEDDYVQIVGMDIDVTDKFTWEAWIYPRNVAPDQVFLTDQTSNANYFRILRKHLFASFNIYGLGQTTLSGSVDLQNDQWYHVAAQYDGSSIKIFLDGVLYAEKTGLSGNVVINNGDLFNIGIWTTGDQRPFNGLIDEVRISDYARYE